MQRVYYFLALDLPLPVVDALCIAQEYYVDPEELASYLQRQQMVKLIWSDDYDYIGPHWFAYSSGNVSVQFEYLSPCLYMCTGFGAEWTVYRFTRSRGLWVHLSEPPNLSPWHTAQMLLERAAHSQL